MAQKISPKLLVAILSLFLHLAVTNSADAQPSGERTITLSVSVESIVNISNLNDLTPPPFTGAGSRSANDNICVYSSASGGRYRITAKGNGVGEIFTLQSNEGFTIPFTLFWNDRASISGGEQLLPSVALLNQAGNKNNITCRGGTNANLMAVLSENQLSQTSAGSYNGSVLLTVEPN